MSSRIIPLRGLFFHCANRDSPLVLGTSSSPVRSIACLMARASALKADSALYAQRKDADSKK